MVQGGCSAGGCAAGPGLLHTLHCPQVLWPYLLEFLVPIRFTGALSPALQEPCALGPEEAGERGPMPPSSSTSGNGVPLPQPSPFPLPPKGQP